MRTLLVSFAVISLTALFFTFIKFSGPGRDNKAEAYAANFFAYRNAVLKFVAVNPTFVGGPVTAAQLQPYFAVADTALAVADLGFTNRVFASAAATRDVYVFGPSRLDPNIARAIPGWFWGVPGVGVIQGNRIRPSDARIAGPPVGRNATTQPAAMAGLPSIAPQANTPIINNMAAGVQSSSILLGSNPPVYNMVIDPNILAVANGLAALTTPPMANADGMVISYTNLYFPNDNPVGKAPDAQTARHYAHSEFLAYAHGVEQYWRDRPGLGAAGLGVVTAAQLANDQAVLNTWNGGPRTTYTNVPAPAVQHHYYGVVNTINAGNISYTFGNRTINSGAFRTVFAWMLPTVAGAALAPVNGADWLTHETNVGVANANIINFYVAGLPAMPTAPVAVPNGAIISYKRIPL